MRGNERYVFVFDDQSRAETLRSFGRYASNPDLSFNWYDAAILAQKLRRDEWKQLLHKRLIPHGLTHDLDELIY